MELLRRIAHALAISCCLTLAESQSFGSVPGNDFSLQQNATYDYVVSGMLGSICTTLTSNRS